MIIPGGAYLFALLTIIWTDGHDDLIRININKQKRHICDTCDIHVAFLFCRSVKNSLSISVTDCHGSSHVALYLFHFMWRFSLIHISFVYIGFLFEYVSDTQFKHSLNYFNSILYIMLQNNEDVTFPLEVHSINHNVFLVCQWLNSLNWLDWP